MAKTVVGLMNSAAEAESVVRDLGASCGCSREDIGLMARGSEGDRSVEHERGQGGDVAAGALKGAGTGAALGGVLGLVAGVASLSIPGVGPFIAAGPIAAALAGAGTGAAAGGLIGALVNIGVPEDEAHYYAEGVRRGGTLITVHARSDAIAECAAEVMRKHGAMDIDERAAQWKHQGWSGRLGEGEVVPVAKEKLVVGKRQVTGGDVRVYSQVTEEVRLGARESKRQKTVRDTVRDTKVEVQKTGGSSGTYTGPERRKRAIAFSGPDRRAA